ncbi:MAG: segregation/condensation protein A [Parcubacteria group bacterium]|nr:segregation/condensation protein A [Parcubacteria group bacterium]
MYKVQLEKFAGPLDLLLDLIEKEKLDIAEVSLAQVADQYLDYLEGADNIDPTQLADFLLIAAKLILIKSRTLLPEFQLEEEDEESIEDLKSRLVEYKRFREAAEKIKALHNSGQVAFERPVTADMRRTFYPGNITTDDLLAAAESLVNTLDQFKSLQEETIKEVVSVKEKILQIQNLISQEVQCKFSSVLAGAENKSEAIVSFLALLELIKQRLVSVVQDEQFGEIEVRKSV